MFKVCYERRRSGPIGFTCKRKKRGVYFSVVVAADGTACIASSLAIIIIVDPFASKRPVTSSSPPQPPFILFCQHLSTLFFSVYK